MSYRIRVALSEEIPALNVLIQDSARELSQTYYTPAEVDGLITHVFGVDSELVEDGTYFVVEHSEHPGIAMACGGWSKRRTLFGGDHCPDRETGYLDPLREPAKIRAFFVHPHFARRGIAKLLIEHCEAQARAHGFLRTELMSTLPGIPFYATQGYQAGEPLAYALPNGINIPLQWMAKNL